MAFTGQFSTASLQDSVTSSGTSSTLTRALSSFISKTSGQVSAQSPHPIQVSSSTIAFIHYSPFHFFLSTIIRNHFSKSSRPSEFLDFIIEQISCNHWLG